MLDQSWFSSRMTNTVWMGQAPLHAAGRVVVLVVLHGVVVVRRPWQTATPSRLQRPNVLLRQARRCFPAATHAAMSRRHAFRHRLERDAASAQGAT